MAAVMPSRQEAEQLRRLHEVRHGLLELVVAEAEQVLLGSHVSLVPLAWVGDEVVLPRRHLWQD